MSSAQSFGVEEILNTHGAFVRIERNVSLRGLIGAPTATSGRTEAGRESAGDLMRLTGLSACCRVVWVFCQRTAARRVSNALKLPSARSLTPSIVKAV